MTGCPTCGSGTAPTTIRKGRVLVRSRGRSLRVYWPIKRIRNRVNVAVCPDAYHVRRPSRWYRPEGQPAEMTTTINLHDPKVMTRQKVKAKRHKESQGKDRK